MEQQLIIQAAEALIKAEETKQPTSPIRTVIGLNNIETAYKVQHLISQLKLDKGAQKVGSKIGLTSFAVQKQLGVDQPDYGWLFDHMAIENGGSISMSELMQPKVEAEIAFVLNQDLNMPEITEQDVINSIDHAVAAIEVVGSRVANWDIRITDTIADNASASHYVLGSDKRPISEIDVVNCKMSMTKNGEVVSEGKGEACLGSPIKAALWLAQTMKKLGSPLRAGEVILSGALGPMSNVESGDVIEAHIEGLGSVTLKID